MTCLSATYFFFTYCLSGSNLAFISTFYLWAPSNQLSQMPDISNFVTKELTKSKTSFPGVCYFIKKSEVDSNISTRINNISVTGISSLVKEKQTMINIQQILKKI